MIGPESIEQRKDKVNQTSGQVPFPADQYGCKNDICRDQVDEEIHELLQERQTRIKSIQGKHPDKQGHQDPDDPWDPVKDFSGGFHGQDLF